MTFGVTTFTAASVPILTPDGAGGVFIGTVQATAGSSLVVTYAGLDGAVIRVYQVVSGGHTWATGSDGSGNPTLTLTPISGNPSAGTLLLVFAA